MTGPSHFDPPFDPTQPQYDTDEPLTGPNPIDTIREALTDAHPGPLPEHDPMCHVHSGYPETRAKGCNCSVSRNAAALAALTEVEHQLETHGWGSEWLALEARAEAAETALAEANQREDKLRRLWSDDAMMLRGEREAAERRANDHGQVLRALIEWNDKWPSHRIYGSEDIKRVAAEIEAVVLAARAALDRQEQT